MCVLNLQGMVVGTKDTEIKGRVLPKELSLVGKTASELVSNKYYKGQHTCGMVT